MLTYITHFLNFVIIIASATLAHCFWNRTGQSVVVSITCYVIF